METFTSWFTKIFDDIQIDFIWNKSRPEIKHSNLIGNYEEGGNKDVDIALEMNSLKVIWIKRLIADNIHTWR